MPQSFEEAMRAGSFGYVRYTYGVPAKRGGRVRVTCGGWFHGCEGRITRADNHVWVRLDIIRRESLPFHPTDLDYLSTPTTQ